MFVSAIEQVGLASQHGLEQVALGVQLARTGHGKQRALRRDTVSAVHRHTDAASHHNAIPDGDLRLRATCNRGIERILLAEEGVGQRRLGACTAGRAWTGSLPHRLDVATRAERLATRALHHDDAHVRIRHSGRKVLREVADHWQRQSVECLGPSQGEQQG